MSRIGRLPITIPEGIDIQIENGFIVATGSLGKLSFKYNPSILITKTDDILYFSVQNEKYKSCWGTYRTLVEQMIVGVSQGFVINLELVGVGYKANVEQNKLILKLGFSHDIIHNIPNQIKIICQKPTFISIIGINKQQVHQEAARIRNYKKPEPYKGKGIIYENEIIIKKEGKKK